MKFHLLALCVFIFKGMISQTAFAAGQDCYGDDVGYALMMVPQGIFSEKNSPELHKTAAQTLCSRGCWAICGLNGSTDSRPSDIQDLQKKCLGDDESSCQELMKRSTKLTDKKSLCLLVGGKYCDYMGDATNVTAIIMADIGCRTGNTSQCAKVEKFKAAVEKQKAEQEARNLAALKETDGSCEKKDLETCAKRIQILSDMKRFDDAMQAQYGLCQNSIGDAAIANCSGIIYFADKLDDQKKAKAKEDLRNFCGKNFPMTGQCYAGLDQFDLKIAESTLNKWCFASPAKADPKIQSKSCWRSFEIAKLGRDRKAMEKIHKRACELDSKSDKKQFAKCMKM